MKTFRHYLAESVRTYHYQIKIAGEPDTKWLDLFKHNLSKFDPVKISDPRSTPIQETPYGFEGVKNQPVVTMDVEFRYPCIEPFVKDLARVLNFDPNCIRMIQADYNKSINDESAMYSNQSNPVLGQTKLPDNGKQASEEYSKSYLANIEKQRKADETKELDSPFAAKKTPSSHDAFKVEKLDARSTNSPMTKITRPAMPRTGAQHSKQR